MQGRRVEDEVRVHRQQRRGRERHSGIEEAAHELERHENRGDPEGHVERDRRGDPVVRERGMDHQPEQRSERRGVARGPMALGTSWPGRTLDPDARIWATRSRSANALLYPCPSAI